MRIFFVTNNYSPYSSGIFSAISATTDALHAQGHEVFIITLDFLGQEHDDPDYVVRLHCPVKFMYKNNYMAIPWRSTQSITQLVHKYKPDIIHAHHPFLLGSSALRVARLLRIPCVFTYHTMYEKYAHYVPLPNVCVQPAIRTIVNSFCNNVDGVVAPSYTIKEYLSAQHIASPITVIPSPLKDIFFSDVAPERLFVDKKQYDLLLVSRFVPEKNIPVLLDVIKKLPGNFRLTLAGYGSEYEFLQKYAFNILNLPSERVRFVHKPTIAELLSLYRSSDLFLFSSQTDTQGLVLAEAMSQGLPVVTFDGPGQLDIVKNGANGFLVENSEQMTQSIMAIMMNNALRAELSSGALATAQRYSSRNCTAQLLQFYQLYF